VKLDNQTAWSNFLNFPQYRSNLIALYIPNPASKSISPIKEPLFVNTNFNKPPSPHQPLSPALQAAARIASFSNLVLERDKDDILSFCVMCHQELTVEFLEAAHIYPVGGPKENLNREFPRNILTDHNVPQNGICLCRQCHRKFDAGLAWFAKNQNIVVVNVHESLLQESHFKKIHDKPIRKPTNLVNLVTFPNDFGLLWRLTSGWSADKRKSCNADIADEFKELTIPQLCSQCEAEPPNRNDKCKNKPFKLCVDCCRAQGDCVVHKNTKK
jgi:hypothetical protein